MIRKIKQEIFFQTEGQIQNGWFYQIPSDVHEKRTTLREIICKNVKHLKKKKEPPRKASGNLYPEGFAS